MGRLWCKIKKGWHSNINIIIPTNHSTVSGCIWTNKSALHCLPGNLCCAMSECRSREDTPSTLLALSVGRSRSGTARGWCSQTRRRLGTSQPRAVSLKQNKRVIRFIFLSDLQQTTRFGLETDTKPRNLGGFGYFFVLVGTKRINELKLTN